MSTKILVTSEIATWVVDGTNKVFNVTKLISNINTIVVNWSEYAQYSFLWTTITLDDAPAAWSVLVTYSYESNYDYLDNSWWIVWEIMDGTVNSSNKVFTAFYPISLVDEVRVNSVAVVWYTIVWNSILLAAAPTTWYVEIDYFRKDLVIDDLSRDRYYTKKEVRDMVYDEISQDDTSVQYPPALVNTAISDWVIEIISHVPDKSRYVSFNINSVWYILASPIDNSITTLSVVKTKSVPPVWRIVSSEDAATVDYSSISWGNIMSVSTFSRVPNVSERYFMWYKLPRNIKRVISVTYDKWNTSQQVWLQSDFLFWEWSYYISNWFIYLKHDANYVIEVELNEYISTGDDNSLIFVDRDDVSVVVYYALRQLYASRESDKINTVSQLFIDKLKSYKRRMMKKRSNDKSNKMRTSPWLIPRK